MAGGLVTVPWYANVFRGDKLEIALAELVPVAARYGATAYGLWRGLDDRYAFQQWAAFPEKLMWERYWDGEEMVNFRIECSSWYQVPLVYHWHDVVVEGSLAAGGAGVVSGLAGAEGSDR